MGYPDFLKSKTRYEYGCGFDTQVAHDFLYPFQSHIYKWATNMGRAAIFADCGLGKTPMQLVWADAVRQHTNQPVIIFAPLAVSTQTAHEGYKFGIPVAVCRTQDDITDGINITNYEMMDHFDASAFGGMVLDESSILKSLSGKYRRQLTKFGRSIPYRLSATATPAPNDLIEIINQAEFLGIADGKEIIARFFIQDGNTTHQWRLRGHAERDFWAWLSSWAIAVRKPSDLGYSDGDFVLPPLRIHQHTIAGNVTDGFLFPVEAQTLQERRAALRESIDDRVGLTADMVNGCDRPWIAWCNLNDESAALKKAIPDAVEVKGSDSAEHRRDALDGFSEGRYRVIVTKPSIAGFGLNWQHCGDMAFVGLSDSWEQYYQAVRRCWRFGRKGEVNAHVITSENEGAVVANIKRKEKQAAEMMESLVSHMNEEYRVHREDDSVYAASNTLEIPLWLQTASK